MADDTAETVRRALIVDDDPLARTLIAASFAEIGFEVLDRRFAALFAPHIHVEKLWTGARWCEGPAWFGGGR